MVDLAKVLKVSSLSALIAALLAPVYIYFLAGEISWVAVSLMMSLLLFWRHKGNIQRLISGEEGLIKVKK